MVVCLHVGTTLSHETYLGHSADLFRRWSSFGDAGVPFFFVLSGFIVTRAHLPDFDHPERIPAYLLKRTVRIYPMYWLVFAMTCLFVWLLPASRTTLPADAIVLIKALLLIRQDPAVVGGTGAPVVFVAWTLQYEMVFYMAMALVLLRRWLLLLPLGLLLIFRLSDAPAGGLAVQFLRDDHLLLFVMGAGLAMLSERPWRLPAGPARAVVALAAVAFVALAAWACWTFPAYNRGAFVLLVGFISTVAILGLVHREDRGWRPEADSLLVRLGHASYALYLIHVPVLSVLCKVVKALSLRIAALGVPDTLASFVPLATTVLALLIVAACAQAALLTHQYIERPLMQSLNRLIAR